MSKASLAAAAAARRARRIIGENGDLFHPECPPDKHGRSSGATYWFCRCNPCKAYNARNYQRSLDRKRHNQQVISTLEPDTSVPGGVTAPGDHLSDAARGVPSLPPNAPAVNPADDNVDPTQVCTPGPTNPDEYRKELLRTFALVGMYDPPQDS